MSVAGPVLGLLLGEKGVDLDSDGNEAETTEEIVHDLEFVPIDEPIAARELHESVVDHERVVAAVSPAQTTMILGIALVLQLADVVVIEIGAVVHDHVLDQLLQPKKS